MFYSSDSGILSREVDNLRRRLNMSLDDTINYDINMDVVSNMVDALCAMSKKVNAPKEEIIEEAEG